LLQQAKDWGPLISSHRLACGFARGGRIERQVALAVLDAKFLVQSGRKRIWPA